MTSSELLSYPDSSAQRLIVHVAPLGLTVLGKAHAPAFVLPGSMVKKSVSPEDFGIQPEDWRAVCESLSQAFHASELPIAVGILQWVPLVAFAGPAWINIPAERRQRTAVYTELARLQHSMMRPRNLQLQLHVVTVHRGRSADQVSWLSISKNKAQDQPALLFTSSHPEKDAKFISNCQSLYQKCEEKVNR